MRTAVFLLSCLAISLLTACPEDEFFQSCPMSESILDTCRAESQSTTLTCVVADHPQCEEKICAKWEDSEPFCSRECEADADCPADSTCQTYLDFSFCVPASATTQATVAQ
ncbi:MAG: hypothetical protein H6745_10575 [Deltaproteobacteria bacterium]|nr:hypothetical protein [Deltaproteobacteria bacterium]